MPQLPSLLFVAHLENMGSFRNRRCYLMVLNKNTVSDRSHKAQVFWSVDMLHIFSSSCLKLQANL